MLAYLATYPRCGAALLRDTVALNWQYATANLYAFVQWPHKLNVEPTNHPSLISYQREGHPRRRMLVSPCRDALTPELRGMLAADDDLYLVKTHEPPPADPIDGEIAVQLVRHPAAAIVSQHRLHQMTHETSPPLAHFYEGCDTGGRWDKYHMEWANSPMPLMRMRFEDVITGRIDLVARLAAFLKLPTPDNPQVMSQKAAHERDPKRNPVHGVDGWFEHIRVGDLMRIWNIHKGAAEDMGYGMFGAVGSLTSPEKSHTPLRLAS